MSIGDLAKAIPGVGTVLTLVEALTGTLKTAGVIRTPEDEIKAKQALAEIVTQQWSNITNFVKATTPDPTRVYVWVNSLIALIRPLVTVIIVGTMFFAPDRLIGLVKAFAEAGMAGWVIISPVLWWFFGPEVLGLFGIRGAPRNGGIARGGSAHLERLNEERQREVRERLDRERE